MEEIKKAIAESGLTKNDLTEDLGLLMKTFSGIMRGVKMQEGKGKTPTEGINKAKALKNSILKEIYIIGEEKKIEAEGEEEEKRKILEQAQLDAEKLEADKAKRLEDLKNGVVKPENQEEVDYIASLGTPDPPVPTEAEIAAAAEEERLAAEKLDADKAKRIEDLKNGVVKPENQEEIDYLANLTPPKKKNKTFFGW